MEKMIRKIEKRKKRGEEDNEKQRGEKKTEEKKRGRGALTD